MVDLIFFRSSRKLSSEEGKRKGKQKATRAESATTKPHTPLVCGGDTDTLWSPS